MQIQSIHHVAIIVSDYQRAKDFYVNILGLPIVRENYRKTRNSFKLDLKLGDSELELFSMDGCPPRPSYPEAYGLRHLAFRVSDFDAFLQNLSSHGIVTEPVRIDEYTGNRFTFFCDPDGLPLEVHE